MSLWSKLFGKREKEPEDRKAGHRVSTHWLHAIVQAAIPQASAIKRLDKNYWAQDRRMTVKLVREAWNPSTLAYHSNSDEFPDCDEFALCALGRVNEKAADLGLKYGPAFAAISCTLEDGVPHLLNLAVFGDGSVELFEPQTGQWHSVDRIQAMRWVMF